jgi:hypothetical protein
MLEHKDWDLEITIKEGKELQEPQKAFLMPPKEWEHSVNSSNKNSNWEEFDHQSQRHQCYGLAELVTI